MGFPQNAKEIIIESLDKILFRGTGGAEVRWTPGGSSNGGDPADLGSRILFDPVWELGGNVTTDPNIGSGQKKGELIYIPLDNGKISFRVNIDLVTARAPIASHPGAASGSYEFYLPPELGSAKPNPPVLDADGNLISHDFVRGAGSFVAWIAGDGQKHFTGSVKWTFREWRAGGPAVPRPKIIVLVEGDEWKPAHPKQLLGADWNMALTLEWGS